MTSGGIPNPRDTGEEVPPFFLPARYKLMFKLIEENRNCTRIGRKPIPSDVKANFVKESKEYHAYKEYERMQWEKE